jgi:hypothetical protein
LVSVTHADNVVEDRTRNVTPTKAYQGVSIEFEVLTVAVSRLLVAVIFSLPIFSRHRHLLADVLRNTVDLDNSDNAIIRTVSAQ